MELFDLTYALDHLTVLVDTREQQTEALEKRLKTMELPYAREKLDFGDYSVKCTLSDKSEINFKDVLAVERKMSLDELANCFCKDRERFTREFERAKDKGAKVYLLVENATWEKVYNGVYRSQMKPNSFAASIHTWQARYNSQILFNKSELSGKLIADILKKEVKERLGKHVELCG